MIRRSLQAAGVALSALSCLAAPQRAPAQIVINEMVSQELTVGGGATSDSREFIELFNAGNAPMPIGGWTVTTVDLATGAPNFTDTITAGVVLAPGDYYVMGSTGVPGLDQDLQPNPGTPVELYVDVKATIVELRDDADELVDAMSYDVYRTGLALATAEQIAEIGDGWWPEGDSLNAVAPNRISAMGRWRDGLDTDNNGRDFGNLPISPGASNNRPVVPQHIVPDVDGLAVGDALGSQYYASFVVPTVIDPAVVSAENPKAVSQSPQDGFAIAAWDNSGGGNAVHSIEQVNSYSLYAYLDTTPHGIAATTADLEWETTIYGIGTTDQFARDPDPLGELGQYITTSRSGATGLGWMFQKAEDPTKQYSKLLLVYFDDGGNSAPGGIEPLSDWDVIEEIDMTTMTADWYELGIDYDPTTGHVMATFDEQSFEFDIVENMQGNFYVGYREAVTAAPGVNLGILSPPRFDLIEETTTADADFDGDDDVDGADFLIWQRNLGGAGTPSTGDANGDGQVTAADLAVWKDQFAAAATPAAGSVPEPTSGVALGLVVAVLGGPRRRPRVTR